jgi:hypothetical protein
VPDTTYYTARLVVKPPFDAAIVTAIAKNHGFTPAGFPQDAGGWARAGDFMLTTNESSQQVLQNRVTALVNFLRRSGHAKNVGAYDINPART